MGSPLFIFFYEIWCFYLLNFLTGLIFSRYMYALLSELFDPSTTWAVVSWLVASVQKSVKLAADHNEPVHCSNSGFLHPCEEEEQIIRCEFLWVISQHHHQTYIGKYQLPTTPNSQKQFPFLRLPCCRCWRMMWRKSAYHALWIPRIRYLHSFTNLLSHMTCSIIFSHRRNCSPELNIPLPSDTLLHTQYYLVICTYVLSSMRGGHVHLLLLTRVSLLLLHFITTNRTFLSRLVSSSCRGINSLHIKLRYPLSCMSMGLVGRETED